MDWRKEYKETLEYYHIAPFIIHKKIQLDKRLKVFKSEAVLTPINENNFKELMRMDNENHYYRKQLDNSFAFKLI